MHRCTLTGKIRFKSEAEAKAEAKHFRKRFGPRMNWYLCDRLGGCLDWHIGHRRSYKARVHHRQKVGKA